MSGEKPRVLDVGNCDPDHGSICRLLSQFDADIDRVMFVDEAKEMLTKNTYDLVLVNRLIFADGSDGLPLVTHIASEMDATAPPIMMISNFEDAQQRAMDAGAVPGFGKSALNDQATVELLNQYLAPSKV